MGEFSFHTRGVSSSNLLAGTKILIIPGDESRPFDFVSDHAQHLYLIPLLLVPLNAF